MQSSNESETSWEAPSWPSYLPVMLVICVGLTFSLVLFVTTCGLQARKTEMEFEHLAKERSSAIAHEIQSNLLVLERICSLYASSVDVERHEFREFVKPPLSRRPSIRVLEWAPRVPDAERPQYEAAARREGLKDFQITERDAQGRLVRALGRDEYFPVHFAEPDQAHEAALGFDVASDPLRREALHRARDTGEAAASARVRLAGKTGEESGFLVFLPVYRKGMPADTLESRRKSLQGFVLGVFRPNEILERALARFQPAGVDVLLDDQSAPGDNRFLEFHSSRTQKHPYQQADNAADCPPRGMHYAAELEVGGRPWLLLCMPMPDFLAARRTWQPWGVLVAGLTLTGLVAAYFCAGISQATRTRRLVDERTGALRASEENLRHSEQQFRSITTSAQDAIIMIDSCGDISLWNEAAARIFGYTEKEALGKDVHELLAAPQYLAQYRQAFPRFRETGQGNAVGKTVQLDGVRKNGETFPVELSLSAVELEGRWHAIAIVRDVTDRKRTEEALQGSEQRYRQLLAAVTTYTYSVKVENGVPVSTEHSLGCYPATGYTPEEFTSDPSLWIGMVHPDDREAIQRHVARVLAGEEVPPIEHRILHKDGTIRWVRDTIVLHRDEAGFMVRYDGLVEDITERERAEEALRKKDAELRQAQKLEAVGQLAGGIAHEFNNLLQAIGGYTNYAMEGLSPDEPPHQDLQQVRKATDRAAALTRQLLGFSRRQALERKNVDPNQVVTDLVKIIRPTIGEHIELELSLAENAGTVHADPGELQEVLLNLCLNARDAMPSGGKLMLRSQTTILSEAFCGLHPDTHPGRYVVISVTDTGCGIPPEVKPHIFEPFFTTKEVGEGTGLGLATVYGVVQQHEGAIHVYSEPGRGTTFKIYLPTVEAPTDGDRPKEAMPAPGGTEAILVAEDEPMVRDIARRILERAGYRVLAASDGEQALHAFEENRDTISLVLLDAVMPKFTGLEVYRQIREHESEVKVIFCTGYDPETSHSDFIKKERLRLVQKPFDPDTLLRTVREVLDREEPCQVMLSR